MIYGSIVKQYENSRISSNSGVIDESSFILESLYKEQENISILLEDEYLSNNEREILEAKYEVIQEAVGAAIIAAIIAAIGALIVLLVKVMKSTQSASNTVKTKINKTNKQIEDKIHYIEKHDQNNNDEKIVYDNNDSKPKKQVNAGSTSPIIRHSGNTNTKSNTIRKKVDLYEKRTKPHEALVSHVDDRDVDWLKYAFCNCLDVDPTFEKYEADFDYLMKNFPEFFQDDDGKFKFSDNPKDWNDDYWTNLERSFVKNYSLKKFNHMRKVAKIYHAEKIDRLNKERDGRSTDKESFMNFKKSIKDYEIDVDIFQKYKDKFKEICKSNFNEKFPGFISDWLYGDINQECIREFERNTRMAAMDDKSFDEYDDIKTVGKSGNEISNKDYIKHMNVGDMESRSKEIADNLKNDTAKIIFTNYAKMGFDKQESGDAKDALKYIYNKYNNDVKSKGNNAKEPCEELNKDICFYLKSDYEKQGRKITNKLSTDLKSLEKALKRLKETNFNKSKIDDNNKSSERKQNSDNYLQNMLYIDKCAVQILSSFVTGLQELEMKRSTFAMQYWTCYTKCISLYLDTLN